MTTKTNFTKNDMIKILSNYKLGTLIDFEPLTKGTVQINFLLKTTNGKFVFKYYEKRSKNSVLFEANLIRYLKDKKYPCPAILRNKHKKIVEIYNKKPYAIFEFVEGKHIEKPNKEQKKQLIKKVAELQNITKNYRPSYKKYRWNYSVELCKKLARIKAKKINTINSKEKLKWLEMELSKLNLPKSLPKAICHCDFDFSNVLFKNNKFNALIDFDDSNYTYSLYDLICLTEPFVPSFNWNTWNKFKITDNVFNFKETKKVVHEYMRYRQLNNNEKIHLFDVYKLSILFDCVWYFKRGKAKDFYEKRKIDYLNACGRKEFYNKIFKK
ncbi:MAG: homoserine kinase [Nanoarchaeota archaeon]|nr:homoserine kinase [Nanoarchaeota archaeon]